MQIVLERGFIDKPLTFNIGLQQFIFHTSVFTEYICMKNCFQSKYSNISAEGLHFSAFHFRVSLPFFRGVLISGCPYFSGVLISVVSLFQGCPYFSGVLISGCPYFSGVLISGCRPYFRVSLPYFRV